MRYAGLCIVIAGTMAVAGCARQCPPPTPTGVVTTTPERFEQAAPLPLTPEPEPVPMPPSPFPVQDITSSNPPPMAAPAADSDIVVLLASDSFFGPSMAAQAVTARYYCSSRGKVAELASRARPKEMQNDIFADYSVLTYHCVIPAGR